MSEDLERLGRAYGIASAYRDIWGTEHRVSERTLRALLGAMGVAAQNDTQVRRGLEGLGREHRRSLPSALVVRTGQRITLRVNLPADRAGHELEWRLENEQGSTHAGKLVPLPATEERAAIAVDATRVEREFVLPIDPSEGYHRLTLTNHGDEQEETLLVVAPGSCFRPSALEAGGRAWGPSAQLYGLRSERNWGIGDFSDLATVAGQWITRGASLVAVSPLHALFPHNPAHASPYSPSSRLFLNALYIDVEAIEDFRESAEARSLFARYPGPKQMHWVPDAGHTEWMLDGHPKLVALVDALDAWMRRLH